MTRLYENSLLYIEQETADIPWLKIIAKQPAKEMTDCSTETQAEIFRVLLILEEAMLKHFNPDKINIASFANYVPQVHWHIMARYKDDSHFPEPMWGTQQRPSTTARSDFSEFFKQLHDLLK